jgi:hypothetical protein
MDKGHIAPNFSTAIGRWSGLGPYYAMFPRQFAFGVVDQYCPTSGSVLDPFGGRGTSIFAATAQGRTGCGIEINPVGWLFGSTKLSPASKPAVSKRLCELAGKAKQLGVIETGHLPDFFQYCFSEDVLKFLLVAREELCWRTRKTDKTVMALLLVYLHGKRDQSLSNQMRQGKSMSPDYSVRWWADHGMSPPDVDPESFLMQRINWRYAKGIPELVHGEYIHGDSTQVLPLLAKRVDTGKAKPFDLLFTSPPYFSLTNYNYDQWLRLWMLGEEPFPVRSRGTWQSKFSNQQTYSTLLHSVFREAARCMSENAVIYVRTDARAFTLETTRNALNSAFPAKRVNEVRQPYSRSTQTSLFGDKSTKPGEIDLILTP